MQYPNAYRGVSKIFIALLISFGMSVLAELISVISIAVGVYDYYTSVFYKIFDGISVCIFCLFYVLLILGVLQAGRDEPSFRSAFLPLCIQLGAFFTRSCLTLVYSYISHDLISGDAMTWIYLIYGIVSAICGVWAWLSIITGCMALAKKREARGLVRFGGVLRWLIPIPDALSLMANTAFFLRLAYSNLLPSLLETEDYLSFSRWQSILSRCVFALSLVIDILLLIDLGRTRKLLLNEEGQPIMEDPVP